MVWICCVWRVLFSTWYKEELVLTPVFLRLIVWALPCPFPNAWVGWFFFLLLLQWFAYCSSREMYFCWSIYYVQYEFSKDTFVSWCSWRSQVYRNENVIWVFFVCGSLFSCYVFHDFIQDQKRWNIYICFSSADSFLKQSLADLLQMRCGQAMTWNMIETAGLTVVTSMILELCQTSLETGMDMFL